MVIEKRRRISIRHKKGVFTRPINALICFAYLKEREVKLRGLEPPSLTNPNQLTQTGPVLAVLFYTTAFPGEKTS